MFPRIRKSFNWAFLLVGFSIAEWLNCFRKIFHFTQFSLERNNKFREKFLERDFEKTQVLSYYGNFFGCDFYWDYFGSGWLLRNSLFGEQKSLSGKPVLLGSCSKHWQKWKIKFSYKLIFGLKQRNMSWKLRVLEFYSLQKSHQKTQEVNLKVQN
jgi:hypothetical protein